MKARRGTSPPPIPAPPVVDPDDPSMGLLAGVIMSANGQPGLTVTTVDGHPATLAVLDETGHVLHSGPAVGEEAWSVVVHAYRLFWQGQGYLKVYGTPEGFTQDPTRED
ncbi:hypothetical protein [Paraburkholderia adhaesiva]|uniref:hypothetical protein n=1 Tax=Paraburkholderia adhaesiva TaxID=2883244 RepID=UPI001F40AF0E|nr:hypothetical protein [Paraburkholderia adhaesiva]